MQAAASEADDNDDDMFADPDKVADTAAAAAAAPQIQPLAAGRGEAAQSSQAPEPVMVSPGALTHCICLDARSRPC